MDDHSQEILDSLPQRASRSRLAPFRELIHELLRRRRTYREIVKVLAEKCNCRVSISTLHEFVRLQSRAKRGPTQPVLTNSAVSTKTRSAEGLAAQTSTILDKDNNLSTVDIQKRIAALKQRTVRDKIIPGKFQYDPNEPLRLQSSVEKSRDAK